jgi:O-methyltransferase
MVEVRSSGLGAVIRYGRRRLRPLRRRARFALARIRPSTDNYHRLRALFVSNGDKTQYDRTVRKDIVRRFERIDHEMDIVTTPTDALFLAEALLSLDCEGDMVECGCYAGGSTAKLSILAGIVGRKLYVFDSFEGLPEAAPDELQDYHARRSTAWMTDWTKGRYTAGLDRVRANVGKWGDISVCDFLKGWFEDTLKPENLPGKTAFVLTDVDVPISVKQCLVSLWPLMSEKGTYFSHDIAFIKALQVMADERLWADVLHEPRPILFGAGFGLCDASPHLGFLVKGAKLAPEYIKSLTISK